jgi:hypothetical protein
MKQLNDEINDLTGYIKHLTEELNKSLVLKKKKLKECLDIEYKTFNRKYSDK